MNRAIIQEEDNTTGIFMIRASFGYFENQDISKPCPEDGSVDESLQLRIDVYFLLSEPISARPASIVFLGITITGVTKDPSAPIQMTRVILLPDRGTGNATSLSACSDGMEHAFSDRSAHGG
jgi:hypothetical protein